MNREFFSCAELNRTLRTLITLFNDREMTDGTHESRSQRFERERPFLKEKPAMPYDINITIKHFKVRRDYCIRYRGHRYSVPHRFVGNTVKVIERPLAGRLDIYDVNGKQITNHNLKGDGQGDSILFAHMPAQHRFAASGPQNRLKRLAPCGVYVQELALRLTVSQPDRVANKTLQGMESERRRLHDDALFNECCHKALLQGKTSLGALMNLCEKEHNAIQKKINHATQLEMPLTKVCMRGKLFYEVSTGEDNDDKKE